MRSLDTNEKKIVKQIANIFNLKPNPTRYVSCTLLFTFREYNIRIVFFVQVHFVLKLFRTVFFDLKLCSMFCILYWAYLQLYYVLRFCTTVFCIEVMYSCILYWGYVQFYFASRLGTTVLCIELMYHCILYWPYVPLYSVLRLCTTLFYIEVIYNCIMNGGYVQLYSVLRLFTTVFCIEVMYNCSLYRSYVHLYYALRLCTTIKCIWVMYCFIRNWGHVQLFVFCIIELLKKGQK